MTEDNSFFCICWCRKTWVAQSACKCCCCSSVAGTGSIVWANAREWNKQCSASHGHLTGVWDGKWPTQPWRAPPRVPHDETQGFPFLPSGLQEALLGESVVSDAAKVVVILVSVVDVWAFAGKLLACNFSRIFYTKVKCLGLLKIIAFHQEVMTQG